MNSFRTLSMALLAGSLAFAGCATTESSNTPAPVPPPPQASAEVPSIDAGASAGGAGPTVEAPMDPGAGQQIPLKSLPTKKGYPYAIKTKWPGLVKSPYAQDKQLVDVSTMSSGSPARCPHTGKIFIVP